MNFNWNADTIKWYQTANEYTGFFKNLAELIRPRLEGCKTLCDIGCGLGLVDLELSQTLTSITCVDRNHAAIEDLKSSIKKRKIDNITPLLIDCEQLEGHWDAIIISFFGSHQLEKFLPSCQKLFAIVDKKSGQKPYLEKYRKFNRNTCTNVEQALKQKRINYALDEVTLEFGQPLVSFADAQDFVRTNYTAVAEADLNRFLDCQLLETNEPEFPFYIPKSKTIGIFEVEGALR